MEAKKQSEFSLKRMLIRLFAYPFCFGLIAVSVYGIIHPVKLRSIIAGIGGIILAGIYLYSDIRLLIATKRKN